MTDPGIDGLKWFALGRGHRYSKIVNKDGDWIGIVEGHQRPQDGRYCEGAVHFDVPENTFADRNRWQVVSLDPLHLEPSLKCDFCGGRGWIRDGKWVPA